MKKKGEVNGLEFRRRVGIFVAPLVLLPAFGVILWAFGIIKDVKDDAAPTASVGINPRMPNAHNRKDSTWNKMMFYEESDKDSARYKSMQKSDPYYKPEVFGQSGRKAGDSLSSLQGRAYEIYRRPQLGFPSITAASSIDENEGRVKATLTKLNEAMRQAERTTDSERLATAMQKGRGMESERPPVTDSSLGGGMGHASADPEDAQLSRLDGMLDKVLEIKYPNRAQGKGDSIDRHTFSVSRINGESVSFNGGKDGFCNREQVVAGQGENGFYSLDDRPATETAASVIHAVIPDKPTLISGARVRLRLDDDITVHGLIVPKNAFVWGIANFSGQRMNIRISSIEFKGQVMPVSLSVYDLDGLPGVNAPGTAERDVAKQSTDQAIQSLSLATMDESVGAQAATASIQAAKTLMGQKIRIVKISVPDNYRVILRDDSIKNNF